MSRPPWPFACAQIEPLLDTVVAGSCTTLAAREFIQLEHPEPGLSYQFRHVLIQEAAYRTLLYAQRRELHRAVAAWYEQRFDPGGVVVSGLPRLAA